jgi:hypothetical protein
MCMEIVYEKNEPRKFVSVHCLRKCSVPQKNSCAAKALDYIAVHSWRLFSFGSALAQSSRICIAGGQW